MIPTRSARVAASSMSWVVRTTVMPAAWSSRILSQTNNRACGSRPVLGSSRKITSGACIRARDEQPLGHPSGELQNLVVTTVGQAELLE
jgi:hypothetical protein